MVSVHSSSSDATESYLGRLHVEVFGPDDAPPLLMLHGWGSSAEAMRSAAAGLETHFRIHNVDLPGHGRTPPPPEPWGVPEFADLVDQYLEREGLSGIPVIAHSNGGRIALFMASDDRYAGRFSRMLLIAPSGVKPQRSAGYYARTAWISTIKAPFAVLPSPIRSRGLAWLRTTIYWKVAASTDYRSAGPNLRETFVKTVRHHLDDRLHRITVPVLVVWGDADPAISRHQVHTLERELQDCGLVVLNGAGHYAYLDQPGAYQTAAYQFLLDT